MPPSPASETSALLPSRSNTPPTGRRAIYIYILLYIWVIAMELRVNFFDVSFSQVMEGIICDNKYGDVTDPLKDARCKSEAVQAELSLIFGIGVSCQLVPEILTSVFYGRLSDKCGRRVVLFLSCLGSFVAALAQLTIFSFPKILPLRLYWATGALAFIGGGDSMTITMILAVVCHITSKAQRANAFFIVKTGSIVGGLIGRPLTYYALKNGGLFTVYCGIGMIVFTLLLAFIFPETRPKNLSKPAEASTPPNPTGLFAHATSELTKTLTILRKLCWDDKTTGTLLLGSFFSDLGTFIVRIILLQYISKRFDYTWAEANLFTTIKIITQLITLLIILPACSQYLIRRHLPAHKDMLLARGSLFFAVIGYASLGLANTPTALAVAFVLYGLSYGFDSSMRGLLAGVADGKDMGGAGAGSLFSVMMMFGNVGVFLAGPAVASSFRWGLHLGGVWMGMPLFLAGGLMAVTAGVLCSVSVRRDEGYSRVAVSD